MPKSVLLNRQLGGAGMTQGAMPLAPLLLRVGDADREFADARQFDEFLKTRVNAGQSRLLAALQLSKDELDQAIDAVTQAIEGFEGLLLEHRNDAASLADQLRSVNIRSFSEDQQWRGLFRQLLAQTPERGGYLEVALDRYLDYLRSRRAALGRVLNHRASILEATGDFPVERPIGPRRAARNQPEQKGVAKAAGALREGYVRLLKGEPEAIRVSNTAVIPFILGYHDFALLIRGGGLAEVRDLNDAEKVAQIQGQIFAAGRYLMGRGADAQIEVNPAYREVSRVHLRIALTAEGALEFTDLSTYGTFVREDFVSRVNAR